MGVLATQEIKSGECLGPYTGYVIEAKISR